MDPAPPRLLLACQDRLPYPLVVVPELPRSKKHLQARSYADRSQVAASPQAESVSEMQNEWPHPLRRQPNREWADPEKCQCLLRLAVSSNIRRGEERGNR